MRPKMLWKYVSEDRVESVLTGLFRFTPPSDLNDPFDANPEMELFVNKGEIYKSLKNIPKSEIFERIDKEILKNFHSPSNVTDTFRQTIYNGLISGAFGIDAHIEEFSKLVPNITTKAFDQAVGMFCLSETNDNILMWSHYANNHKGIAIGFNSSHPFFTEGTNDLDFKLQEIKYSAKRPKNTNDMKDGYKVFFQKSPDWKYEREWRMFAKLDKAHQIHEKEGGLPIHLFQIPIGAIECVVFGMKMPRLTQLETQIHLMKESIINRIVVDAKPLRFYKATKHPTLFKVNIEPIS
ncbi:DUF2971 domain-containing protein [Amylibacter sp. SFDW26]|uniref:DUF2971 domain-containing protein n=1 Tax=Amylibacter sp. SFDW26 TaxID=2652722 RepID=UPI0012626665|nr:DUF2971 domain-containing protein [Amylibacter sp. SFDW26]KAB7615684.1 DUF2971 domain-containing protein [Amylibacter sp. SFDW26]